MLMLSTTKYYLNLFVISGGRKGPMSEIGLNEFGTCAIINTKAYYLILRTRNIYINQVKILQQIPKSISLNFHIFFLYRTWNIATIIRLIFCCLSSKHHPNGCTSCSCYSMAKELYSLLYMNKNGIEDKNKTNAFGWWCSILLLNDIHHMTMRAFLFLLIVITCIPTYHFQVHSLKDIHYIDTLQALHAFLLIAFKYIVYTTHLIPTNYMPGNIVSIFVLYEFSIWTYQSEWDLQVLKHNII